ncbi:MAG: PD-(D/E)XK nuclease family protein [Pseudomonadota bacterium]
MSAPEIFEVRASAFGRVFDCAYAFEWETLMRRKRATSLRAHLGTSIHASTAVFDQARLSGAPITADEAADVFDTTFWEPSEDVDFKDPKLSTKQAELIGLTLHARYCAEIAPLMNFESVEMKLKPMDVATEGVIIRLTGTMDRARVARVPTQFAPGNPAVYRKVIADLKTGGRLIKDGVVSIKARAAQLGTYQILSEYTDGEQTAGAQIMALQTTTVTQVGVSRVFDAKRQLIGHDGAPGMLEMAGKMFKIGLFPPNPASALCDKKYCGRWNSCPYKGE